MLAAPLKQLSTLPAIVLKFTVLPRDNSVTSQGVNSVVISFLTALITSTVVYPFEYARTLLATDTLKPRTSTAKSLLSKSATTAAASTAADAVVSRRFGGVWDTWRLTRGLSGVSGVYRGFSLGVTSMTLVTAMRLWGLEIMRLQRREDPQTFQYLNANPLAGTVSHAC